MGMHMYYRQVLPRHLPKVRKKKKLLSAYTAGPVLDQAALDRLRRSKLPREALRQIERQQERVLELPPVASIGKAWDALDRLLLPVVGPVVHGVEPIERIETSYGHPSLVDTDDVQRFAAALAAVAFEAPAPGALGDAYPGGWEEGTAWLGPSFEGLRRIYEEAAEQGRALICWLG